MEFQRLSDEQLLTSLEQQFAHERKTTYNILLHLKEIQARQLYVDRGFPNLFALLVDHFHQSETAANQRIKALGLMTEVPIVEDRLVSGELTLSAVAMAQRQICREEKLSGRKVTPEKKIEIVEAITGKTIAQAEKELFRQLPETAIHPASIERRVSAEATRLHVTLPEDVREMMQTLKERWAHVDPTMDAVEVMRRAFKVALAKTDPTREIRTPRATESVKRRATKALNSSIARPQELSDSQGASESQELGASQGVAESQKLGDSQGAVEPQPGARPTKRPTYYARELDRTLWMRAGSQCEFIDPMTKRRCSCKFGLQREHVIPLALGGSNELSNMQLLCRPHNLLRARKAFGAYKINAHILRKSARRTPVVTKTR